jgi:hypothetical protein
VCLGSGRSNKGSTLAQRWRGGMMLGQPLRLCEPEMILAAPRISPVVRISVDLARAQAEAADSQSAATPA